MPEVGHYVRNEQGYKDLAYEALEGQFVDRAEFDAFYSWLQSDHRKDDFLRVASFYLYLVKRGDWHVRVQGGNEVVDYLTNSFKLVALFSLIESLTDLKHQDSTPRAHSWASVFVRKVWDCTGCPLRRIFACQ